MSEAAPLSAAPPRAPGLDPGPPQAFLASAAADAASLALFAGGGVAAGALFPFAPASLTLGLAGVGACLGPLACAIERGATRRPSWAEALALAGLATACALGFAALAGRPLPLWAAPALLLAGVGLARLGERLDRGEAGWRHACRCGPPTGSSPLADRIAALAPPRALAWALLPLLPLTLALRGLCLLAILTYQLTASRLMPPSCRYEPSCSRYGFAAYLRYGCLRGSLLTALRLVRCSPIGPGGYDPVPGEGGSWFRAPTSPHESDR